MNLISEQALGLVVALVGTTHTASVSVAFHWHFNGLCLYKLRVLTNEGRANGLRVWQESTFQ